MDRNKDFVEDMEKRRAAREERRRQERAKAESDKKEAAAGSKAERERAERLALAKRSVTRTSVCVPRFDSALSKIPLMPKEGEDAEVNGADAWWNSTMPRPHDPSTQDKTLYKEGDNTPRDEHIKLIQKYAGKPVPAGFRGIWDEIPSPERLNADIPHKVEKFVRASKVHKYDTEEEKRKKQKAYDNLSLAEQRAFDRAQSAASKKSEQDEADADAAAEAEEQALLDRLEANSYEAVMAEYREYEKLKLGRTNECEGTSRARPSNSQDPAAAFQWTQRLRKTPVTLKHSLPEIRAKAAMRFADMTEFLKEDEAADVLELGVIDPLMDVWAESQDETSRENVWGWLQATKEGTEEKMLRHTQIISISFCRAIRNLSCALLNNFNLQPVEGRQLPGTVPYPWLNRPSTFLEILMLQPGVFDLLCRQLSNASDECKEHAAYALKNLTHHDNRFKQMLLDAKALAGDIERPVLETLRIHLENTNYNVQGAASELLCSLFYNDEARAQVLKHRGAKGVSVLPTVGRLMTTGSDHSQAMAARIVWDLCVKFHRDWNAQAMAAQTKAKSLAATKRTTGRKLTVQEASQKLGDGSMVDFVKQDICREKGLVEGLTHLLNHGAPSARVTAAGAVWALCVERGNKRYLAQNHALLRAIAATINDVDAPSQAQGHAASALRNLATDLWVMDCMAAADKDLVKVLLRKCEILNWQHSIVSPAINMS